MNGLITVGIPLGIGVQILTSGLSLGAAPPVPVPETTSGILYLDIPKLIVDGVTGEYESLFFNLPAISTRLSVMVKGTSPDVSFMGSLDGVVFSPIAELTEEGITSYQSNVKMIQAIVNSGTAVSVTVIAKREKF